MIGVEKQGGCPTVGSGAKNLDIFVKYFLFTGPTLIKLAVPANRWCWAEWQTS